MNLIPLVSSNFRAARIRPMFPSLIRSASDTPWFWYFFATATTKRRFERTSVSSAPGSPSRMARARRASSSRSISGYALISRRYWSSDSDSAAIFLGGLNDMRCSGSRNGGPRNPRFYPAGTAGVAVGSGTGWRCRGSARPCPSNGGGMGKELPGTAGCRWSMSGAPRRCQPPARRFIPTAPKRPRTIQYPRKISRCMNIRRTGQNAGAGGAAGSVHQVADAAPAHAAQPGEGAGEILLVRVVHEHGPPLDGRLVEEAPVARILGVVAVVAQREVLPLGHHQRAPVVAGGVVVGPVGGAVHQVLHLPVHLLGGRVGERVGVARVRLHLRLAVQVDDLVAHLQGVAAHPDDPLDVVAVRVVGRQEDDDVAAGGGVEGGEARVGVGDLGAVDGLVHQQEVA